MSNQPPLQPALVCQKCGAVNPPHAKSCWVCDGQDNNPFAPPPALEIMPAMDHLNPATSPTNSRVETVFTVLLVALMLLTVLVGIGIGAQDQGMLVMYAFIVLPAYLAVGTRAMISLAKRERPKASTLFMAFIWSGVITVAILFLLIFAAVVALFVMCSQILGPR